MKGRLVEKKDLFSWIDRLAKANEVIAPVKQENFTKFAPISSFAQIVWGAPQSVLPPKQFFSPQQETLLRYEFQEKEIKLQSEVIAQKRILVGVHPCDLNAIYLMDQVWAEKNKDDYYLAKRQGAILVGVDCLIPCSPEAFCLRMGGLDPKQRFDLFITDLGKNFLVEIQTSAGEKLLGNLGKEVKAADFKKLSAFRKKRNALFSRKQLKLSPKYQDLPKLMKSNYQHPLWEERGKKCYGCGSCNMVCPTCYCFDVKDQLEIDLKEGTRDRIWDGCLLADFAKVGSGENFREHRSDRLRHRTYRKLYYLFEKWGESFCTGCGRCVRACLTKIVSPLEIANELGKK